MLSYESGRHNHTHIIIGMSNDKDIDGILSLMPENATYYFTQSTNNRAFPAVELATKGATHGLTGQSYPSVEQAVTEALKNASPNDFILISGSVFVVGEALSLYPDHQW